MKQTLSVTDFNSVIKKIFDAEELLHNVKICGEVFGISKARGAVYFSVKDEQSSLPCICFASEIFGDVKEGDQVVLTGSPNFYVKGGRFSFIVSKIEFDGQGVLFQKFLELKEKLEKEGLFDQSHKKPIPKVVKRIGVVTSRDGAVLQDIKNVTWRRNPGVDIVLFNTKVQGLNAENEIAAGIDFFSNYEKVDVVIVARGGGSLEDLWAYNTEVVARSTFNCEKPIVSAVGHETDFTIIDFVSDLRAPTPSAAAELLSADTKSLSGNFKRDVLAIRRMLENYVANKKLEQSGTFEEIFDKFKTKVENEKQKLKKLSNIMSVKINTLCLENDYALKLKLKTLEKLDPLNILSLGYAKIEQDGVSIGKLEQLNLSKNMDINFVDGGVTIFMNASNKEDD